MEESSPEQTCCLMSMMLYSFVDPIIVIAAKVPHLSYDELPPQPYYDQSKHLIKHAFRVGPLVFNGTFRNLISLSACRLLYRFKATPPRVGLVACIQ